MKRIMAFLAIFMVIMPYVKVHAATTINGSVRDYQVGDEVNFYRSDEEKKTGNQNAGQTTIVLSTERVDGKYIKVLAFAPFGGTDPYYDKKTDQKPLDTVRKMHISNIGQASAYPWESAKDLQTTLTYITLQEVIDVFGATKDAGTDTYTIDVAKWGEIFATAAVGSYASKGIFTGTYDVDADTVWVIEFEYDSEDLATRKMNKITVKKETMTNNANFGYLPVVYFDETYDCHYAEEDVQDEYACYSCDDEYIWTQIGDQAENCELVPDIKVKANCAKNPETGVKEYLLEFIAVAGICGLAIVLIKRKDLFKTI